MFEYEISDPVEPGCVHLWNPVIYGYMNGASTHIYYNVNQLGKCKRKCEEERAIHCKAIDWRPGNNVCYLQPRNRDDLAHAADFIMHGGYQYFDYVCSNGMYLKHIRQF